MTKSTIRQEYGTNLKQSNNKKYERIWMKLLVGSFNRLNKMQLNIVTTMACIACFGHFLDVLVHHRNTISTTQIESSECVIFGTTT